MPRRRRRKKPDENAIYALLMFAGGIIILGILTQALEHPAYGLVVLVVLLAMVAYWVGRRRKAHNAFVQAVSAVIERHIKSLVVRRLQLVTKDPYGKPIVEKWHAELDYFIDNHVEPLLNVRQSKILHRERSRILLTIASRVESEAENNPTHLRFSEGIDPRQFEVFCAEELKRSGWDAQVTPQSCDQGADVIAEKEGARLVLQCKLYRRPVGNKAVQEIVAARAHQMADYGVVVTNNSYTSAATQLAATNRVLLLHYLDLSNLDRLLASMQGQVFSKLASHPPSEQI